MRVWTRAAVATLCGRCGETVAYGEPIQAIEGLCRRRLWRCRACANGDAPPDLPTLEAPDVRRTKRMVSVARIAPTVRAFVTASREPGEDG